MPDVTFSIICSISLLKANMKYNQSGTKKSHSLQLSLFCHITIPFHMKSTNIVLYRWHSPDMDTAHFFIRFNSVSESFDPDQLMTHSALQELIQISPRLKQISEILFKSTHDSKSSQNILKINSRLKNFPEF